MRAVSLNTRLQLHRRPGSDPNGNGRSHDGTGHRLGSPRREVAGAVVEQRSIELEPSWMSQTVGRVGVRTFKEQNSRRVGRALFGKGRKRSPHARAASTSMRPSVVRKTPSA